MNMSEKIVILGGGGSLEQWLQLQLLPREQNHLYDAEVWAINFVGLTVKCDRIIAMDPIDKWKEGEWEWPRHQREELARSKIPVTSSMKVEGIDVTEYPLKEVTEFFNGFQYFNTTVAYAVALAIYEGATHIGFYGIDFTWPGEKNLAEEGRACVEFWIRDAMNRGINIHLAGNTTLLDQYKGRKLYGYPDNA